ncbi:hypothetical protein BECAL_01371 [Bellilinea caldifistulae]|nr:hypothetical protein BECAL_01371 [Bellilinea caldifistulae]
MQRAGLGSPAQFPQGLARIGGLQAEERPRHALQVDALGLSLWVIALAIRVCSPAHPFLPGGARLPHFGNRFVFHLAKVDDGLTRIGQFHFPYTSLRIEGRLFILPCQTRPAGVTPAGLRGRFGKDLFLKVLRPFGQVSPAGFTPTHGALRSGKFGEGLCKPLSGGTGTYRLRVKSVMMTSRSSLSFACFSIRRMKYFCARSYAISNTAKMTSRGIAWSSWFTFGSPPFVPHAEGREQPSPAGMENERDLSQWTPVSR